MWYIKKYVARWRAATSNFSIAFGDKIKIGITLDIVIAKQYNEIDLQFAGCQAFVALSPNTSSLAEKRIEER